MELCAVGRGGCSEVFRDTQGGGGREPGPGQCSGGLPMQRPPPSPECVPILSGARVGRLKEGAASPNVP